MRTTLTLESEIAEPLRLESAFGKRPFKEVVNDALHRSPGIQEKLRPLRFKCILTLRPSGPELTPEN